MERATERTLAARAVELGRSADSAALPELDGDIEYWGMDTLDYKIGMLIKQQMYQHAGKRLISLYPKDKSQLDTLLREKLLRLAPPDSASAPSVSGVGVTAWSKNDTFSERTPT